MELLANAPFGTALAIVQPALRQLAADRLIAPYGVYTSTKDKVNLTCTQIRNPEKPFDSWEPRNLEVGKMTRVSLTDTKFQIDARFDPRDTRYERGFLCCVK